MAEADRNRFRRRHVGATKYGTARNSGPFAGLNGHWSGSGSAALANGSTERIHCRANYTTNGVGTSLSQQLRCASDSYRLEISANVVSSGGSLSGSWSEATHGQSGSLSGHAAGATIRVQAVGGGFSAGIGIRNAVKQSVGHDNAQFRHRRKVCDNYHAQRIKPRKATLYSPAQAAQKHCCRPQYEQIGEQRSEHREGAEPAKQPQRR